MYKLRLTRREKKQLFRARWFIMFGILFVLAGLIWFIWIRPQQQEASVKSFEACVRAGNPVQETYPEICLTKNGKRFVNTKQQQAHQDSQSNKQLVAPTNPALLVLDIDEWGVRVPLTTQTFDLTYAYLKNGGDEGLLFSYKRLINMGVCKGDIGLRLSRTLVQNDPPFSLERPQAVAHVGQYYYYPTYAGSPCYDASNADQVALVTAIAGDKTLTQATTDLIAKLTELPKEN